MEAELINLLAGYGPLGLVVGLVALILGRDFWRISTGRSGGSDGNLTAEFHANNLKFDRVLEKLTASNAKMDRLTEEAHETNERLTSIHAEIIRSGRNGK